MQRRRGGWGLSKAKPPARRGVRLEQHLHSLRQLALGLGAPVGRPQPPKLDNITSIPATPAGFRRPGRVPNAPTAANHRKGPSIGATPRRKNRCYGQAGCGRLRNATRQGSITRDTSMRFVMTSKSMWMAWLGVVAAMAIVLFSVNTRTTGNDSRLQEHADRGEGADNDEVYVIQIPDYHDMSNQQKWRDETNDVSRRLHCICADFVARVADPSLPIAQRMFALGIVENFGVNVFGAELVSAIEFEDDRAFTSSPARRGPYPVVTVLAESGSSGVRCIIDALKAESVQKRRVLLCDALEYGVGLQSAESAIVACLQKDELEEAERERLTQVLKDIRSRWDP